MSAKKQLIPKPNGNGAVRAPVRVNNFEVLRFAEAITRQMLAGRLGKQFGGKRDLYTVLGYETVLSFPDFLAQYKRTGIGRRVVNAPADATWRRGPEIYEDNTEGTETPFEQEFGVLEKRLRFWNRLMRADRLAGIGRYGVIVIGVRGQKLNEPLKPNSLKGQKDVLYLTPYSEGSAQIQTWQTREDNPRFGKPLMYQISIGGGGAGWSTGDQGGFYRTRQVHWTRVIHIADDALEDEVYGTPRLEACFNRLYDHEKVVGGAGETFWLGAYRGPVFNVADSDKFEIPTSPVDTTEDEAATKTKMEEYMHGLMRTLRVEGYDVSWPPTISPRPTEMVDAILSDISTATGIPKRILQGSERGELASSQDEGNWNSLITSRRTNFAEPMILRAVIDRLIQAGALPAPQDDYVVEWPNLFELTAAEKMDIAGKTAAAIAAYAPPGMAESVVPAPEFRELVLGLDAYPDERYLAQAPAPEEEPLTEDELTPSGEDLAVEDTARDSE